MEREMQAVVMTAVGGPEVLELRSVPRPAIVDPHQIEVRIMAAGLNPADLRIRNRLPPVTAWEVPAEGIIQGLEGAGIVEAVGSAVTRFRKGDEVYFCDGGYAGAPGSYAQFKVLDEHYAARKPRNMSFEEAATMPVVTITGWEALHGHAGLMRGEYLLVQGGAGGLGHVAIQLGKLLGAHVAATVSTPAKAQIVERLGADRAIMYRTGKVGTALQQWTGKGGVDVVYDTVGDGVFDQSIALLAPHGRLVTAAYPTAWPTADIFETALKNIRVSFEAMGHALGNHEARVAQTAILEMATRYVEEGSLAVLLDRIYPLVEAGAAQQALERGEVTGKIALAIPQSQ